MSRRAALAALLCAAQFGAAWPVAAATALANPGFDEPASGGRVPGWSLEDRLRPQGEVQVLRGYPGANGQVLVLRPNARNSAAQPFGVGQVLDAAPFRGQTFTVAARLAATPGATAIVGVHALGPKGDLAHVQLMQGATPDGALVEQSQPLSVPGDARQLVVYAAAGGTSGRAIFDAIVLDVSAAQAAAPVAAPLGSGARVQVDVDVRKVVRRIPAALFGANVEWIWDGQGMWSAKAGTLDPQAVALARDIAPTVLRFPGGVFSDAYNWRDGIGPQAQRPTTRQYPGGPSSRHSFGSQEVAELARDIGADLLFTANAGSGTAREAAEWVAYAAREIRPKPKWWEVGNELYLSGDLSGGSIPARKYADRYLEFAAAMRSADPTIRVGAIGGLNEGAYRFISDDHWTETLLQRAARQIDFLAVHNAYAPVLMGVSDRTDPALAYRAMLAAPRQVEANLQELSRLLARYEDPARPIGIAVTEWGPLFHVLPGSPWVDHAKTMGSALYVASTLNVFMRSPRVEMANFFKLIEPSFMGMIGRRGEAWAETAPALAFRLYRKSLGSTLVGTDVRSPVFDALPLGAVNAQHDVPWVDAVATYDAGTLVVMLVNRSDTQAFQADIALRGVASFGAAQRTTLSAATWDANTGTQLPRIPGIEWAKQVQLARFAKGAPDEVRQVEEKLPSGPLQLRLPPVSITALRMSRVKEVR